MGKSLALLSGKGGSGKTTLALSISSLLSDCGISVLLIDCDFGTNGATYFYEGRMQGKTGLFSSDELFADPDPFYRHFLSINENMDFMPSIVSATNENRGLLLHDSTDINIFKHNILELKKKYDVVIFDCQAGYSYALEKLLPFIDVSLVVMEADAISSAAMRSLYLKIGDLLKKKRIYQVFNKASDEEYEIYSKISGGTLFTNIETVRFDWKIRKAFSLAQIPNMKDVSAKYGEQVYNICKVLFNEDCYLDKLSKFDLTMKLYYAEELEEKLKKDCLDLAKQQLDNKHILMRRINAICYPLIVLACLVLWFLMTQEKTYSNKILMTLCAFITFASAILMSLSYSISTTNTRGRMEEISRARKALEQAMAQRQQLQEQLEDNMNDEEDDETTTTA